MSKHQLTNDTSWHVLTVSYPYGVTLLGHVILSTVSVFMFVTQMTLSSDIIAIVTLLMN